MFGLKNMKLSKIVPFNKKKTNINLIVAKCKNNGIGYHGSIPWYFKNELRYFAEKTKGKNGEKNAIIMGRKTWDSLPIKPLPHRDNYILSNTLKNKYSYETYDSLLDVCREKEYDNIWIIGGVSIYRYFLLHNLIDYLYITHIHNDYECDTFFPFKLSQNKSIKLIDGRFDKAYYIPNENELFYTLKTIDETYENDIKIDYCVYTRINDYNKD